MTTDPATASTVAAKAADATPTFQDIAKQYLVEAIESAKNGVEWLKGQIPDVLTQFVHWKIAENAISFVVFAILTFISGRYFFKLIKWFNSDKPASEDTSFAACWGVFFTAVFMIIFGCIAYGDLKDLVELIVAPKVYLLEYAADLVKHARQQ